VEHNFAKVDNCLIICSSNVFSEFYFPIVNDAEIAISKPTPPVTNTVLMDMAAEVTATEKTIENYAKILIHRVESAIVIVL